jgi:hypothetical protein
MLGLSLWSVIWHLKRHRHRHHLHGDVRRRHRWRCGGLCGGRCRRRRGCRRCRCGRRCGGGCRGCGGYGRCRRRGGDVRRHRGWNRRRGWRWRWRWRLAGDRDGLDRWWRRRRRRHAGGSDRRGGDWLLGGLGAVARARQRDRYPADGGDRDHGGQAEHQLRQRVPRLPGLLDWLDRKARTDGRAAVPTVSYRSPV